MMNTFSPNDALTNADEVRPGDVEPQPVVSNLMSGGIFRQLETEPGSGSQPRLYMDIAGLAPGTQHDVLSPDAAELAGPLHVRVIDGFDPQPGDLFEIISSPNVTGQFSVAQFAGLPPGLLMTIDHSPADGLFIGVEEYTATITFAEPDETTLVGDPVDAETADFDDDGDTDLLVLLRAESGLGTVAVLRNAGVDGSGEWQHVGRLSVARVLDTERVRKLVQLNEAGHGLPLHRNAPNHNQFQLDSRGHGTTPSAECVGGERLGQISRFMIQRDLDRIEGAKAACLPEPQFHVAVHSLHDPRAAFPPAGSRAEPPHPSP